jgi:AcrR family transcriptional regulator
VRSRERILAATVGLLERSGFDAVNVAAVAAGAGVSRQTVYAQFGSREELVSQALTRVMDDVMAEVDAGLGATSDAADYLVELFVALRHQFRRRAVLGALLFEGHGSPLFDDGVMARATPVATAFLGRFLEREPRPAPPRAEVVELILRMGLSVLLFDSDAIRSDDGLRAFLRGSLVPVLFPEGHPPAG